MRGFLNSAEARDSFTVTGLPYRRGLQGSLQRRSCRSGRCYCHSRLLAGNTLAQCNLHLRQRPQRRHTVDEPSRARWRNALPANKAGRPDDLGDAICDPPW